MYTRDIFKQQNMSEVKALIEQNALAMLVVNGEHYPQVFQVPLMLCQHDDNWVLKGHVAIANPLAKMDDVAVLVVFNGADVYISPGYYATKQQDPKVVPTWNYTTVQLQGRLQLKHDLNWKLDLLNQLTQLHEASQARPWNINDAPADYIEKMTKGIVGIEVDVCDVQAKWKASQNQPDVNRQSVAEHLSGLEAEKAKLMADIVKGISRKSI